MGLMARNPVRHNCAQPHQCSLDVRMQVMARSPLTKKLNPQQHRELDQHLTSWAWAAGDPILLAGEQAQGSYMVAAGRARITRDTIDGREITVDIAAPGDVIGPLHTHSSPATDSAWAIETTCALYLPAEALAEVVDAYPQLALAIMRMQQNQLVRSRERETAQTTSTVEQRVAAALQHLDAKLGQIRQDGSSLLQVRLRRDDVAGMAGTTVESTSRAMARMKKTGVIDSGREWIAITNHQALADLVAGL